jgi:enamine deaminase RidA (YjgF/YER057c/UK114 family)
VISLVEQRLATKGLIVPEPPRATGNYLPFTVDGTTVYLAGATNDVSGEPHLRGKVPVDHGIEAAQEAARICGLNLLGSLKQACGGDLDRVERCLSVRGYVNATPDFALVPAVINGASDLFVLAFGEAGKHARTSIGVATLPRNALVEVDAIFRLKP